MATLDEIKIEVASEIESQKPLYGQVNNQVNEFTEAEYEQWINQIANDRFNEQQFGYIQARQEDYGSIADQLDMMYWDGVNGTTVWSDHIAQVKSDNPKPV
jgi:hypothetical protein